MMIMRELTGGLYFGERKTVEVDGVLTGDMIPLHIMRMRSAALQREVLILP